MHNYIQFWVINCENSEYFHFMSFFKGFLTYKFLKEYISGLESANLFGQKFILNDFAQNVLGHISILRKL